MARKNRNKTFIDIFALAIHAKRISLGLSQEDLARKAGVSPATVSLLENAKIKNPAFDIVFNVSKVLGLNLNALHEIGPSVMTVLGL